MPISYEHGDFLRQQEKDEKVPDTCSCGKLATIGDMCDACFEWDYADAEEAEVRAEFDAEFGGVWV